MDEQFLLIEAAQSGHPRVMGIAYSGAKMSLPGWRHPVVVDLAGLQIPEMIPLLADHRNQTSTRVGMIAARVEDGALVIEGEILSSSDVASGILEQSKAGADWQLSIGAEVKDAELIAKGRNRIINGQSHEGPFYHVKASVLREVSVVAVGADATTRMKVAASFTLKGDITMEFTAWLKGKGLKEADLSADRLAVLRAEFDKENAPPVEDDETKVIPAPKKPEEPKVPEPKKPEPAVDVAEQAKAEAQRAVQAERSRVSEIQSICAGEFTKIEQEAISTGWSADQTRDKVLHAMRAARPQADVGISIAKEKTPMESKQRLEAALCFRAGIDEETLVADYGEETVSAAYHDRDISLQQIFVECANAEGVPLPRHFSNDTIRASFSTVSLPGLLNSVANKRLLKSFKAQPVIATRLCSEGELTDFKEAERYRLTDVGDLEPVAPDGEIKHGGLSEEKATNQLQTYGKLFCLTRKMIFDDDLQAFLRVPEGMGARAARKVDQIFFERLLSNPGSLFSVAHKNYKDGVDTALSPDSLATAVQQFMDQTDSDQQPINIAPRFLLVPTGLKMTAREILSSSYLMSTGSTNKQRIPTYNPLADEDLEIVCSPYLSNTNYSGHSTKAWYLLADPAVADTFEIAYLRGRRTPSVEQGQVDFNVLGIQFRIYWDLACREQDFRGVLKFNGE